MHARCCAEGPELRGLVVLEGTRARRDSRPAAAMRLASAAFSHLTGGDQYGRRKNRTRTPTDRLALVRPPWRILGFVVVLTVVVLVPSAVVVIVEVILVVLDLCPDAPIIVEAEGIDGTVLG